MFRVFPTSPFTHLPSIESIKYHYYFSLILLRYGTISFAIIERAARPSIMRRFVLLEVITRHSPEVWRHRVLADVLMRLL